MEAKRIIHRLISTNRMHKKTVDRLTANVELKRENHFLLMMLSKSDAPPSQKEIAKQLNITPAAVVGKMKKLEAEGFIERIRSGEDKRFNSVSITEKGRKLINETRAIFDLVDKKTLEGISSDELEIFISVLEKMQKNLKDLGGEQNEMV